MDGTVIDRDLNATSIFAHQRRTGGRGLYAGKGRAPRNRKEWSALSNTLIAELEQADDTLRSADT